MDATTARSQRLDIYSQWLADDVDGITFNLANNPAGQRFSTAVLADARERGALALSKIERAIEADKASHQQECVS